MECNKEEALRAKEIAETKMRTNDFETARRVAVKAQQLYPELDNIAQLLAVCDVHCSARNYISNSDKDWYGILQLEKLADELTVKKQYRKLALVLHPDKNKFPGAEAAFKLIGEANMVLSDPGRRSLYDCKLKFSSRTDSVKAPPHQVNRNVSVRQNGVSHNDFTSQFAGLYQHQTPQSSPLNGQEAFWTCCPFCSIKYQYYREFVNRALRCQKCDKPFIAYDVGAQGIGPKLSSNSSVFQQKDNPNRTAFIAGFQKNNGSNFNCGQPTVSHQKVFPDGNFSSGFAPQSRAKSRSEFDESSRMTSGNCRTGGGRIPTPGAEKPKESRESRNKSRRRGRKQQVESSESYETSTSEEIEGFTIGENENTAAEGSVLNNYRTRRSSRKRQHVSYNEDASDVDFETPPKRSHASSSARDVADDLKAANAEMKIKENVSIPREESSFKRRCGKQQVKGAEKVEVILDSESDSASQHVSEPMTFSCPDPEFNDFDRGREKSCFEVGQIWACYDTADSMPRFYALVRRVSQSNFSLEITWLEHTSCDYKEKKWIEVELPVGCGKFKRGSSESVTNLFSFSHKVDFARFNQTTYAIYPQEGQIWALFKDWDIGWFSNPEIRRQYEYEIVEVLPNHDKSVGIRVAYLEKVQGFVSLFQRKSELDIDSFVIGHSEWLRFSHQIPSFRMMGNEREDVPEGSFELDPAALLMSDISSVAKDDIDSKSGASGEGYTSCPKSPAKGEVKRSNAATAQKSVDSPGQNGLAEETSKLRRSSRSNINCKIKNQVNDATAASFPGGTSPEVTYDFGRDRSDAKFEVGQIWAVFTTKDSLPTSYVQIRKIETAPLKLHVASLEECSEPNTAKQKGRTFKVQIGKPRIYSRNSFSHLVIADSLRGKRYVIRPKAGQIWAIRKNTFAHSSSGVDENCQYEIVNIIKSDDLNIVVLSLEQVSGLKSVFGPLGRQRSASDSRVIPLDELSRFSHQIPAIQLSGEKSEELKTCWELDPASVPGHLLG